MMIGLLVDIRRREGVMVWMKAINIHTHTVRSGGVVRLSWSDWLDFTRQVWGRFYAVVQLLG
jgi:hypothetical protein